MARTVWGDLVKKNVILGVVDANLRGASQVFFQNNSLTGSIFS